ncbi:hypothetical protein GF336_04605 [Candidatus Woesearchaeota archaeon]|nr:hypothetical protein [Candidatus Woesearchaeota archaeon]
MILEDILGNKEDKKTLKEVMHICRTDSIWDIIDVYCCVMLNEQAIKERRSDNCPGKKGDKIILFPKLRKIRALYEISDKPSHFFENPYAAKHGLTQEGFKNFLRQFKYDYESYNKKDRLLD